MDGVSWDILWQSEEREGAVRSDGGCKRKSFPLTQQLIMCIIVSSDEPSCALIGRVQALDNLIAGTELLIKVVLCNILAIQSTPGR